jgi:multicomponent Na+:H+ antiporter subunit B
MGPERRWGIRRVEIPVEFVLFQFLILTAVCVAWVRNLLAAAMLLGLFSLLSAGLLLLMDAPDVSFTEAAVGAGMSTVLVLSALSLTDISEKQKSNHHWGGKIVVVLTGMLLMLGTEDMPVYGDPDAPIHRHVAPEYIEGSARALEIPNIVTSVLASYRGYDTFGETTVVLTAAVGTMILLLGAVRPRNEENGAVAEDDPSPDPKRPRYQRVRENIILRIVAKILLPFILLFSLYVQFHGDFGPGGGFQAGVIFAAGWILYGLIFGLEDLLVALPPRWVELGIVAGVLLYGGVGVISMLEGGNFLSYGVLDGHSPVHGQHRGVFWIELGVGITVAAVMIGIFYTFAGRRRPS